MKSHLNGAFVWTVLLGLFVLFMIHTAQHFPDLLQFTPNLAGYGTLVMIAILIIGNFYPSILSWTETTLQDLWGDTKPDNDFDELEDQTLEKSVSWPDVIRAIGYLLGFLIFVFVLGFSAVTPVYITLYLVAEARVHLIWAALTGVFVTALIVTGMVLLHVEVWAGLIPEIIPDYLGGSILPPV